MADRRAATGAETEGTRMVQRDWPRRDRAGRLNRQRRIPAWTSSVCEIRSLAALGGRRRGVASDTTQRRADALHDGHRRADHDRLHAHAPALDFLGVVLRRLLFSADGLARLGRRRRGRGLLSLRETSAGRR